MISQSVPSPCILKLSLNLRFSHTFPLLITIPDPCHYWRTSLPRPPFLNLPPKPLSALAKALLQALTLSFTAACDYTSAISCPSVMGTRGSVNPHAYVWAPSLDFPMS